MGGCWYGVRLVFWAGWKEKGLEGEKEEEALSSTLWDFQKFNHTLSLSRLVARSA